MRRWIDKSFCGKQEPADLQSAFLLRNIWKLGAWKNYEAHTFQAPDILLSFPRLTGYKAGCSLCGKEQEAEYCIVQKAVQKNARYFGQENAK